MRVHSRFLATRWFCIVVALLFGGAVPLALSGCFSSQRQAGNTASPDSNSSKALFKDVAEQAGLAFKHDLGNAGRFYIIENTPPGCAFVDYDNDGNLDIFLVQSGSAEPSSAVKSRPYCALYRNKGSGAFVDVTAGSGLDKDLYYGQGVAVGDYDNDGYDDLFITAYGGNHLLRNKRGSGQFEDVTKAMGLDKVYETGYATSAAFGDYNKDGRLDLFVCYYIRWTHAINEECRDDVTNELDYCFPGVYEPVPNQLFQNNGKKFVDVTKKSGIVKKKGHGLALSFLDYNRDGWQDIYIANDLVPAVLWHNNGDGTFKDTAIEAGIAYGEEGMAMAAMGIAIGDYDNSGHESLYVSNFSRRPNILFKNLGNGIYEDATQAANLGFSHHDFLSFGCEFFDYDADGWSDLITNNGHVQTIHDHRAGNVPYKQRKQLLHNEKGVKFNEITDKELLGDLTQTTVGRGLATGDYNNDGRVDVLAVSQNGAVELFENRAHNGNHWVSFQTIGTKSNRNGIHARIAMKVAKTRQAATVRGGTSYLSASDRRVYFGLGSAKKIDEVAITWPSGTRETLKNLPANTFYTLTEGKGVSAQRPFVKESGDLQNTATSAER